MLPWQLEEATVERAYHDCAETVNVGMRSGWVAMDERCSYTDKIVAAPTGLEQEGHFSNSHRRDSRMDLFIYRYVSMYVY